MIPRLTSGWPKVADSAAIRTSHAIDSSFPPPKASALTAAIVTTEEVSIRRSRPCIRSSRSWPPLASIVVKALMSAPAQNSIGLAEANTSARVGPSLATASHTRSSASTTSGAIELAGGRSSQAIATSWRVSSLTGESSQPLSGRA
jgi:hypothetical protein